jgi:hypothetical protein
MPILEIYLTSGAILTVDVESYTVNDKSLAWKSRPVSICPALTMVKWESIDAIMVLEG